MLESEVPSRLEKENSTVRTNLDYTVRPGLESSALLGMTYERVKETEMCNQSKDAEKEQGGFNQGSVTSGLGPALVSASLLESEIYICIIFTYFHS